MNTKQLIILTVGFLLVVISLLFPITKLVPVEHYVVSITDWKSTIILAVSIAFFTGLLIYITRDKDANSTTDKSDK